MKFTPSQLADAQAALAAKNDGLPWQYYSKINNAWETAESGSSTGWYLHNGYLVRPTPAPVVQPWTRETIPAIPFGVIQKCTGNATTVMLATDTSVSICGVQPRNYLGLLNEFIRSDSSPCGILSCTTQEKE